MKSEKSTVGFEHPAKGPNHCGDCVYFRQGTCTIVAGRIEAEDWCRKFKMKTDHDTCFGACVIQKSPSEMALEGDTRKSGQGETKEHDQIRSNTTGKLVEISLGPNSNGLVPANPFASLAQEGWAHSHPDKFGRKNLAEWDAATKGKKLPEHVKKSK
jgi:hypothetical protein